MERTIKLLYENELICEVLTNHSMSVDDILDLMDIDMDAYARAHGWDGWDYEELRIEF